MPKGLVALQMGRVEEGLAGRLWGQTAGARLVADIWKLDGSRCAGDGVQLWVCSPEGSGGATGAQQRGQDRS